MLMNVQDVGRALPPGTTTLIPSAAMPAPTSARKADIVGETVAAEIVDGFRVWQIWTILGWDDIRQRYRRSVLGPFWITLSMGMFIFLLGIIYSRLFHTDVKTYIPFLSAGFTVWGFISQTTNESCMAFHEGSRIIKQIKLPYSTYILRVVWRNFIVFLHTAVIFIPVAIIFKVVPNWTTLYVVPGMFLVCVNVTWIALVLGILSTRYRDMQPIVATGVQIMMFATPIMWPVNSLNGATIIAEVNPLYHLIELVRAPMLGTAPELKSWLVAGGMAIVGSIFAVALLVSKSRRIVFWL
jgi:ABC-2 type transport system permease protein/lipopolysaccharide transport system permease protein